MHDTLSLETLEISFEGVYTIKRKACECADAFIQTLSIFLDDDDADGRYTEENLRKDIDSFRRTCEIAAYRLRAKNILLVLRKYSASPQEKDVIGCEQGNHSHNSTVGVRL